MNESEIVKDLKRIEKIKSSLMGWASDDITLSGQIQQKALRKERDQIIQKYEKPFDPKQLEGLGAKKSFHKSKDGYSVDQYDHDDWIAYIFNGKSIQLSGARGTHSGSIPETHAELKLILKLVTGEDK